MRTDDGYLANMQKSMERAAEYIALAEKGDVRQLIALIDKNTLDSDRHPNQIILGLVMVMGSMRHGTGRSMVQVIRKAAEHWGKDRENADLFRLWTPN